MPNSYYNFGTTFSPGSKVRSDQVNTQYQALETAFDQLPADSTSLVLGTTTFCGTSAGAGNAYTVTPPNSRASDASGDEVVFIADKTNTGAVTLNVDGNGAQSLVSAEGSALVAGDITSGITYVARYDLANTRWQLITISAGALSVYVDAAAASASAAAASAVTSASEADDSAASAVTSAAEASASGVSAAAALVSEGLAQEWADNAIDAAVTGNPGLYSARHWADGAAQAWATQAEDSAIQTSFGGDGATTFSAFHWAQKAAASSGLPSGSLGQTLYNNGAGYSVTDAVTVAPAGSVELQYNGSGVLRTFSDGVHIADSSGGDPLLGFYEDDTWSTRTSYIASNNVTGMTILHDIASNPIFVYGRNSFFQTVKLLDLDPDFGIELWHDGVIGAATSDTGFEVYDSDGDHPIVDLYSSALARRARFGYTAGSDELLIENEVNSGHLTLSGTSSVAAAHTLLLGDPDAEVDLYYDGSLAAHTEPNGFVAVDAGGNARPSFYMRDTKGGANRASFQAWEDDVFYMTNHTAGGDINIRVRNGLDTLNETAILCEADGNVNLYYAGVLAASATAFGMQVFDTDGSSPALELLNNSSVRIGLLQHAGSNLFLRNSFAGFGAISLQGRNSGDTTDRFVFNGDPDGAASLYHLGVETAKTRTNGFQVGAANPIFEFQNAAFDTRIGYIHMNTGTALQIRSESNGSQVQLQGADTGGTVRSMFIGDPDGPVSLYYAGTETLTTRSGGVDITSTGNTLVHIERNSGGYLTMAQGNGGLLLTASGMNTSSQYTPALWFGSTDADLTTTNPKKLAAIAGRATQTYSGDTTGGMGLDFFIMTNTPGATPDPERRLTISGTSAEFIGVDDFDINHSASAAEANFRIRNSEGGFKLTANGDAVSLNQTNASGTQEDIWILFNNNADVALYNNGVEEFRTQDSNGAHNTSGAEVADHGGTFRDVGWNVMPIIEQDATTTADENDVGKYLHKDDAAGSTLTLPSGTSGAVPPVGATIMLSVEGTGNLTISAAGTLRWFDGSGSAPSTGNRTLTRGGIATAFHYANTEWHIWGNAGLS